MKTIEERKQRLSEMVKMDPISGFFKLTIGGETFDCLDLDIAGEILIELNLKRSGKILKECNLID